MSFSHPFYKFHGFASQGFRLPKPTLTEANLPDQSHFVALITGGYTGVGYEVASILYSKNATVWIAGRSESKGTAAIDRLQSTHPASNGKLLFLKVDLSDLTTIGPAVADFARRNKSETGGKLHWLDNNAGIMAPPAGSAGAQGLDLQLVTNVYGPFLFTKLLLSTLRWTAEAERKAGREDTVRVSWAGSAATFLSGVYCGVAWEKDGKEVLGALKDPQSVYAITKSWNWWLAQEFGRRYGNQDGVLHNAFNPGNLRTELQRTMKEVVGNMTHYFVYKLSHPPQFGGYTELYAGLSSDLSLEKGDQGAWIVPWGRKDVMRPDMAIEAAKGENGFGVKAWEWCENVTREFDPERTT